VRIYRVGTAYAIWISKGVTDGNGKELKGIMKL
jgi:hypothetical protein